MSLNTIIRTFHGGIYLSKAECAAIEDYLFGDGIMPPLPDGGVLKTVIYLKDLCEDENFKCVQDILDHFEKMTSDMHKFVVHLIQSENN